MSQIEKVRTTLARNLAIVRERMQRPSWRDAVRAELRTLLPALKHTVPAIVRTAREDADASLIKLALENAARDPYGLAIEMGTERFTWRDVDDQTSRVAHVLADAGVRQGDVVALLGANSPLYIVLVLGISRIGATAALINSNLEGQPLSHAITSANAKVLVTQGRYLDRVRARDDLRDRLDHVLVYDGGDLEERMASSSSTPFPRAKVGTGTDFVYIYTSGTTGLPKPCRVTHARTVIAGNSFGHLFFGFRPGDKLYCVLPLYHSNGLMLATGSCIVTGTPLALRESFSASQFWTDVQRYRATHMIYIGELCRYLVNTPPTEAEKNNTLRVAVGNGMRSDVWPEFVSRFGIGTVREFYGATEAPGLIVNLTGRVGSIGRVPLQGLGPMKLIRYDVDADAHVRDASGYCVQCRPHESGELVFRLAEKPASAVSDFRGYTDPAATQKKVLTDVFEPGDRYYRSGDLLRMDDDGFFYFVDRIGDTFRWKGENVSTAEVADVLGSSPDIKECTVSSVLIPGMEGQAGLAAVVCENGFDPATFWRAAQELPAYAQPRFVRVLEKLSTTGTFKIQKTQLRSEGVNPSVVTDPIFLRQDDGYVRLTPDVWAEVTEGRIRL